MSICLNYKDNISIVVPKYDKYGSESIDEIHETKALFIQNTGWSHSANNSNIDSNATLYVDPKDEFVQENSNRLEGMMVIANPFGFEQSQSWYRIIDVNVNQDKLLCNQIDNIALSLKKSTEIGNGI